MSLGGMLGISFGRSKSKGQYDPYQLFNQFTNSNQFVGAQHNLLYDVEQEIARRQASPYLTGITGGLEGVKTRLETFLDQGNFADLLSRQAAASTDAATRASVMAARVATGSRGGLGYGGGAGAIAGRSAALAGASTGEALLSALVGGKQMELSAIGQLGDISTRLGAARATQEDFYRSMTDPRLQAKSQFLNLIAQLANTSIGGPGSATKSSGASQYGVNILGTSKEE